MSKFEIVKKAANDMDLSSDTITKMLRLLNYAKQQGVEMYLSDGKLRMRDYKETKKSESFEDIMNGFNDIFGGKKKG